MVILRNWSMQTEDGVSSSYAAPECTRYQMVGHVYGHPFRRDGEVIQTSQVEHVNWELRVASCHARDYFLAVPADPAWVAWVRRHAPQLLARITTGDRESPRIPRIP